MRPSQSPDLGGNTSSTDRLQLIWALELVRVRMKKGGDFCTDTYYLDHHHRISYYNYSS